MAKFEACIWFCAPCRWILCACSVHGLLSGGTYHPRIQMAHEELERGIVRVRQVIDALVQPNVPQSIILDFCAGHLSRLPGM